MFSQIVLTATSLATSPLQFGMPCKRMQVRLAYCSFQSLCLSKIPILLFIFKLLSSKTFIFSSFCFQSFSYSSNLAVIKSTASCNLFMCNSPLNWFSCFVLTIAIISSIFCSTLVKYLNEISPHSGDCKLPVKISSNAVLFKAKELDNLPSLSFF